MRVKLKDITKFSKGTQINGKNLIEDGAYSYLNGGINPSGKWNEFNVAENTVTISEGGNSSGYVNYMNEAFWCGAHCYYLYDGPKNSKYLYYALKSQQERLFRIRSGACMPNIKKSDLGNFIIEYEEDETRQEEVVKVLEKCELLIEDYNKKLALLDEAVRARFMEMFSDNHNELIRLADVCTKITDGTHKTPNYLSEGITFISAKNIVKNKLDFSDVKYISKDEYQEIQKRCQTEFNDILLSKSGSLGTPVIVKTDKKLGLFESLAVLKYDRSKLVPEFLCEQLKSEEIQRQFKVGVKGVAIKHLHLGVIGNVKIIVPPLELQNQFASFVKAIDKSRLLSNHSLFLIKSITF
jgi:type I restriction enzyme S subunit